MRKVAILMGSWARRRSTIIFSALAPQYQAIVIAAKRCAHLGETDLQLPTRRLTALRDILGHIPKLRHGFGWGSDHYLFGLGKALADVDIVLSGSPTCLFSYQAACFCERTGKPLVLLEAESVPFLDFKRRIYHYRARALSSATLVAAADMVVARSISMRSWQEQWGLVLSEAMSTGVPVISTYSGSIPEVVGDCGILVQPAGPLSLVDAIKLLASSPELRSQLGESGRARVLELYDWRVAGPLFARFFDEALAP